MKVQQALVQSYQRFVTVLTLVHWQQFQLRAKSDQGKVTEQ